LRLGLHSNFEILTELVFELHPKMEVLRNLIMEETKYKMRVVRGAFTSSVLLDSLEPRVIEKLEGDEWQSIESIIVTRDQIRNLQGLMVHHFEDNKNPWYMDGYDIENKDNKIVAFGGDDGEGGKIFQFKTGDQNSIDAVVKYGTSKGIPSGQMDFMDIDF